MLGHFITNYYYLTRQRLLLLTLCGPWRHGWRNRSRNRRSRGWNRGNRARGRRGIGGVRGGVRGGVGSWGWRRVGCGSLCGVGCWPCGVGGRGRRGACRGRGWVGGRGRGGRWGWGTGCARDWNRLPICPN